MIAEERTVEVTPLGRRGRYSLTPQMQGAYIAIVRALDETGKSPTLDEIAETLGLCSRGAADYLVTHLQERGWVSVEPYMARGIRLLEPVLRDLKPHPIPN